MVVVVLISSSFSVCVLFVLDKRAAGGFPIANEKGESSIIEFSTTLSERFMGERKGRGRWNRRPGSQGRKEEGETHRRRTKEQRWVDGGG